MQVQWNTISAEDYAYRAVCLCSFSVKLTAPHSSSLCDHRRCAVTACTNPAAVKPASLHTCLIHRAVTRVQVTELRWRVHACTLMLRALAAVRATSLC
eukprot:1731-Heterococcus_DN1.PRE.2